MIGSENKHLLKIIIYFQINIIPKYAIIVTNRISNYAIYSSCSKVLGD